MKVTEVNDENYESEIINSTRPVASYFGASWCKYCTIMKPRFENVASKMNGSIKLCEVDVDKSKKTANKSNLRGIPCIILYKNGREVGRIVGVEDEDVLIEKIESHLADIY